MNPDQRLITDLTVNGIVFGTFFGAVAVAVAYALGVYTEPTKAMIYFFGSAALCCAAFAINKYWYVPARKAGLFRPDF